MNRSISGILSLTICAMLFSLVGAAADEPSPPVAIREPKAVTLGGQSVTDDYWWLRDKKDPRVIDYLKAENAYTAVELKPTQSLQDQIYNETLARIRQTDETVPYRRGDWWYSSQTIEGKQYPVYLRRHGSPTSSPVVIADVNAMAAGHRFFSYTPGVVSPDGNLLAFATDTTGNRQYLLQIKDLTNDKVLDDKIPLADTFAWMNDNHTLYYVTEDESKRSNRLYRHELGTPKEKDELIYEEKDEQFSVYLAATRDRKYLVVGSESKDQTEVRVLPADKPAVPLLIARRRPKFEYQVDHRNGRFYIRTNDTNQNFRIVTAPDDAPAEKNWTELVPADPVVVIDRYDVFAHHLVLAERRNGLPQLTIGALPDGEGDPAAKGPPALKDITFSEPDYDIAISVNDEFDPPAIRFSYASLTTPSSLFDYNLTDGNKTLLKQQFAGDDFKPSNYQEERVFAAADDGAKIPISIVYRKSATTADAQPAHPKPLLLQGYGSYGFPNDVYFSASSLALLNRGVTIAVAHVRGGGEYGRAWYDAGRMKNKTNTFTDFIACAKYLQSHGYTTPGQTAMEGGSAGGLLMGAVLNRAPELFHAAVAEVPWVDVLADMSDASIPLTTEEYIEWGNPNVPAERAWIAAYDPYSNVRPQAYPDLFVLESLNDSQVQYWDAARWVARLRAAEKVAPTHGQLLLKMDMDAGHGGASGRYSALHERAMVEAWLLTRLGVSQ